MKKIALKRSHVACHDLGERIDVAFAGEKKKPNIPHT